MKARTASRLAWAIGIASIALIVAQVIVMYVDRRVAPPKGFDSGWSFANVLNDATNIIVPAITSVSRRWTAKPARINRNDAPASVLRRSSPPVSCATDRTTATANAA